MAPETFSKRPVLRLHVIGSAAGQQVLVVASAIGDHMAFGSDLSGVVVVGDFIRPKDVSAVVDLRLLVKFVNRAVFFLLQGAHAIFIPLQRAI